MSEPVKAPKSTSHFHPRAQKNAAVRVRNERLYTPSELISLENLPDQSDGASAKQEPPGSSDVELASMTTRYKHVA